jgi:hypothetical protein
VVPGLQDYEILVLDQVDQAMLGIDPSRPAALEHMAKWFRFSDARQRDLAACPRSTG